MGPERNAQRARRWSSMRWQGARERFAFFSTQAWLALVEDESDSDRACC